MAGFIGDSARRLRGKTAWTSVYKPSWLPHLVANQTVGAAVLHGLHDFEVLRYLRTAKASRSSVTSENRLSIPHVGAKMARRLSWAMAERLAGCLDWAALCTLDCSDYHEEVEGSVCIPCEHSGSMLRVAVQFSRAVADARRQLGAKAPPLLPRLEQLAVFHQARASSSRDAPPHVLEEVVAVLVSESPRLASLDIGGKCLDPKLLCKHFEQLFVENNRHHPGFEQKNLGRYCRGVANILMDSTRISSIQDARCVASLYRYLPCGPELNMFQVDDNRRRCLPSSYFVAFVESWASMEVVLPEVERLFLGALDLRNFTTFGRSLEHLLRALPSLKKLSIGQLSMEERHCLTDASIMAALSGEIPSTCLAGLEHIDLHGVMPLGNLAPLVHNVHAVLTGLSLSGSRFRYGELQAWANNADEMALLKYVKLTDCGIGSGPDDAVSLALLLSKFGHVEHLDLCMNPMSSEFFGTLAEGLSCSAGEVLRELSLGYAFASGRYLDDILHLEDEFGFAGFVEGVEAGAAVAGILKKTPNLESLSLSGLPLYGAGLERMQNLMVNPLSHLKEFELDLCGFGGRSIGKPIVNFLQHVCSNIEEVILPTASMDCIIGLADAARAFAVSPLPALKRLRPGFDGWHGHPLSAQRMKNLDARLRLFLPMLEPLETDFDDSWLD